MTTSTPEALLAGRYRLDALVGEGGMGSVYRAADVRLHGRPCAVKILAASAPSSQDQARFERELQIITRLRSPHVVQVFDTGRTDDGQPYIVMELLEGETLGSLLAREGSLPAPRATELALGILDALSEAHGLGIVHRDLKPANVFVVRGATGRDHVKVLDFGIAKDTAAGGVDLTGRQLIGTPRYMAPEQFMGRGASPQTDLYAFGLLLHEMLGGQPAFDPDMPVPAQIASMSPALRLGYLHVNAPPRPLTTGPLALRSVVAQLLEKSPERRFAGAGDVLAALRGERPASVAPPPRAPAFDATPSMSGASALDDVTQATGRFEGARRLGVTAAIVGVVGGGLVFAGASWLGAGDAPAPPTAVCRDHVTTSPPGATLTYDGRPLGTTPAQVGRPCGQSWVLQVALEGHDAAQVELHGDEPGRYFEVLHRTAPPPPSAEPPDAGPMPPSAPAAGPPSITAPPATRNPPRLTPGRPARQPGLVPLGSTPKPRGAETPPPPPPSAAPGSPLFF